MSKSVYNVLLLSFSPHSHQRNFVPLFSKHPRIRLVGVTDEADIDPDLTRLNRQWAADLNIPYIVGVDQALSDPAVDIVSIGHEIERRSDLIQRTAAAGKHLWIDKFTGGDPDQCAAAAEAIERAGVKSIVPSYTYGTLVRHSLEIIRRGTLGRLLGIHADVLFSKGWPQPIPPDQQSTAFMPPGRWKFPDIKRELLTVGSYAVGLIQACLGPIERVYAHGGAHFFPAHAARGAEDFSVLTLSAAQGATATISCGRIGVATHPAGGSQRAFLVGSRHTAYIDAKRPAVDAFIRQDIVNSAYIPATADPMQWTSGPPALAASIDTDVAGLATGLEDLLQALDQDRQPTYTATHACSHMAILWAAYTSIIQQREITLPLASPLPQTSPR
jgi:predicted dehydrogenase